MTKVTPGGAAVTPAFTALTNSLAAGYGSGATSTHHRALVLSWFGIATDDPRLVNGAVFDPDADYTKLGARGIEMALAHYTAFLHDPLNEIALKKATSDAQSAGAITLPAGREAAARAMIVDCVDMILSFVVDGEDFYTTVWDIAKASYEPTWTDVDDDGIADDEEAPINLTAPVLSASTRDLSVTNGTWTGTPTSYTYVWYLDGEVIDGQEDSTWTAPDTDEGDVQVAVYAINDNGTSERALSNIVAITAV